MRPTLVSLLFLLVTSTLLAGWSSSGPLGGAVNVVVVAPGDPKVIWAGSGPGVFRSTDGGATWAAMPGAPPDVAKIAVHPTNANKAWALSATLGLYKTTDGGATWTSMNRFAGITPTALLVDPQNPDTLFVAGNCFAGLDVLLLPWHGVHKTTDGGATWTMPLGNSYSACPEELAIDPFSPWRLFETGSFGSQLESYDRGDTWERPDGLRPTLGVIFDPRYPFTHYGITARAGSLNWAFLVSQDGGFTWNVSAPPPPVRPNALTIDPQRGRLFLATETGLFRSGDGGRVWAKTSLQDVNVSSIDFGRAPEAVFAATNQGLVQVAEHGVAESRLIDLHQIATYPWAMDIDPSDPNILYASASDWSSGVGATPRHGSVFRTLNGGASWERVPGDDGIERDRIAIDAAGTVYAAQNFRGTTLYRRKRGEETWTPVLNFGFINGLVADPKNPGTVFVSANGLLRSRDSGESWRPTGVSGGQLAIDPSDPRWVYAGSEDHLYRSSDGGDTWIDLRPAGFIQGTRGIVVAPSKGTVLYRIGANGGSPRPERSDDRGESWRAAPLPHGEFPTSLAVDPRDENSVWAAVFPTFVYSSRGLFHSTDGGAHWVEVKGPFGEPVGPSALRFDPSGRVLHVAYPNHGVWELTTD